jgi:hypothetical protein
VGRAGASVCAVPMGSLLHAAAVCAVPNGPLLHDAHLTGRVQEPRIATTLVGMATRDMVRRNVATVSRALSAQLSDAELAALDAIQSVFEDVRDVTWHSGRPENN